MPWHPDLASKGETGQVMKNMPTSEVNRVDALEEIGLVNGTIPIEALLVQLATIGDNSQEKRNSLTA